MSAPYDGRVDDQGYGSFATATGSLPLCLRCGDLVGDRERHTANHEAEDAQIRDLFRRVTSLEEWRRFRRTPEDRQRGL